MADPLRVNTGNTPDRRYLRKYRVALLIAVVGLLLGLWGWWIFISPLAYQPPENSRPIYAETNQRVFVYGTLRYPLIRRLILRQTTPASPAILPDYRKQGLDIVRSPGAMTQGLVFTVTPQGLRRLDRYERIGLRYDRVLLTLADGKTAWVYQRLREQPE